MFNRLTSVTRRMGIFRFIVDLGIFAGPVTLSTLVDYFGFGVPLLADAGLITIRAVSLLFLLPASPIARRTFDPQ